MGAADGEELYEVAAEDLAGALSGAKSDLSFGGTQAVARADGEGGAALRGTEDRVRALRPGTIGLLLCGKNGNPVAARGARHGAACKSDDRARIQRRRLSGRVRDAQAG